VGETYAFWADFGNLAYFWLIAFSRARKLDWQGRGVIREISQILKNQHFVIQTRKYLKCSKFNPFEIPES